MIYSVCKMLSRLVLSLSVYASVKHAHLHVCELVSQRTPALPGCSMPQAQQRGRGCPCAVMQFLLLGVAGCCSNDGCLAVQTQGSDGRRQLYEAPASTSIRCASGLTRYRQGEIPGPVMLLWLSVMLDALIHETGTEKGTGVHRCWFAYCSITVTHDS